MKQPLVLVFLTALCLRTTFGINDAQMKAAVKLIRNTCRTKTKISDEQILKMHQGDWTDDDEVVKCYAYCCLGMMKMRTKNGGYDKELAQRQFHQIPETIKETLIGSLESCENAGQDLTKKCDISYAFYKCVYDFNPEAYMFP